MSLIINLIKIFKFVLKLQNNIRFCDLDMIGTLYIRLLQLTILPVIAANIIVGEFSYRKINILTERLINFIDFYLCSVMAKMDPRKNGKMGLASMGFVLGFDIISGAIGVITAVIIRPGVLKFKI